MIRFGTSGWRSILGEEFTFPNARRVVSAIARVAKASSDASRGLVVASDTRFLNERFVDEASRVLAREGVTPLRANRDVPTPVVAFTIRRTEGARRDQLHRLAQPARVQRDQVLDLRRRPGAART